MVSQKVNFNESRILQTTFLMFLIGFLMSFFPEENYNVLAINMTLALLYGLVFLVVWRLNRNYSKRYFSLLTYVMINGLAIYFTVPFFRMVYGSVFFWLGILVLLIMVTLPYLFAEEIAVGTQKHDDNKLGKIYVIYVTLLFAFGGLLFTDNLTTQGISLMSFGVFGYLMAILFWFLAPIFLIKGNRMKKILED